MRRGYFGDGLSKAGLRNVALLERHARQGVVPTRGDYWFVLGCIGVVVVTALVPLHYSPSSSPIGCRSST
jgi:hypothetical protein